MRMSAGYTVDEWVALPEWEREARLQLDDEQEAKREKRNAHARERRSISEADELGHMIQEEKRMQSEYCAWRSIIIMVFLVVQAHTRNLKKTVVHGFA